MSFHSRRNYSQQALTLKVATRALGFSAFPSWSSIIPPAAERSREPVARTPYRARRIQAELEKLGFTVSLATVSRHLPKRMGGDQQRQRWITFLRSDRDVISAMNFLVVPTIRFRILFVGFVVTRGRRETLHLKVTDHPTTPWLIQQVREALPDEPSTRFLIHGNDAILSDAVREAIGNLGIESEPTFLGSPWKNGIAERWVGSVRRELLDHVVVIDEPHLRRLIRDYAAYYNEARVHTQLPDAPRHRAVEDRASASAKIIGLPRIGGLHHRYTWSEAA